MNATLLLESPDRIFAKAWADEDFKAELMVDPRAALAAQGIEVPEGVTLVVHENTADVIHMVLPNRPDLSLTGEMLDQAVGAARCGGGGCGGGRCGGGCGCGGGACSCLCW